MQTCGKKIFTGIKSN